MEHKQCLEFQQAEKKKIKDNPICREKDSQTHKYGKVG